MEIIIQPTSEAATDVASRIIARLLRGKPDAVLGLATGSTPLPLYQLLGIGTDGHIGFNEPTSSLASRTRIKTLTPRTRGDNARFFGSEESVPRHVITMGIGTIMEARQNLLLAFGPRKAGAIAAAIEGPVTSFNPASILQMHPVGKVCLDEDAACRLTRADYYKWVYDNKPGWQQF